MNLNNPLPFVGDLVRNQPKEWKPRKLPFDRLTREQKREVMRERFGLYHGPGKSKRKKKGGKK